LFSRRVPLYIWLPIVLACAAAGFIASTLRPVRPIPSNSSIPRSEAPSPAPAIALPAEAPTRTAESQISRALGPPRDAAPIAHPSDEIDLPTPASSVTEHREKAADDAAMAAPPVRAAQGVPPRARAAGTDRSGARTGRATGRAQRTAQPAKVPSTTSAGLKNVPIFGPLFSLFQ
jgi:hypothetical protein